MPKQRAETQEEIDEAHAEMNRERGIDEIIASMTVETAEAAHRHFVGEEDA